MLTTADYLFAEKVFAAFRSIRPDIVTVVLVVKKLLENNIDITQLQAETANHCPWAESTEGGSSA